MRNTKTALLALAIAAAVLSGAPGAGAAGKSDDPLKIIQVRGYLVAGLDDTFAPMGYRNADNDIIGFDIDMGNELAKRLGIGIKWQPTAWDGVILALDSGRFDVVISGMTVTDERKKAIAFSIPYVNDGLVMVVRKGTAGFETVADLKGRIVGTQAGSSGEESLRSISGIREVRLYKTYPEAFNDLQVGRIPVVVVDAMTAGHYLGLRPGIFAISGRQLTKQALAIGMRKSDVSLKAAIDEVLAGMLKDGTLTRISLKWFGKDITTAVE